jgi:hypothetical protein
VRAKAFNTTREESEEKIMARIVLKQEQYKNLQTHTQQVQTKIVKSFDSDVEIFDYEEMKKYLVYFPNNRNEMGEFNIVKGYLHTVMLGRSKTKVRCIQGLVNEDIGYDGECPLCAGVTDAWDYFKLKVAAKVKAAGIDMDSEEGKQIRSNVSKEREVQEPNLYLAMPIVVIESEISDNKMKPVKVDGKYVFKPYVYFTSDYSFTAKIRGQFDNAEIEDLCGQFGILSYVYDTKGKKPEKRAAGQNMSFSVRSSFASLEKYAPEMDKLAEFLTEFKINNAVASFALYPKEELDSKADRALQSYKQNLQLIAGGNTTVVRKKTATPDQALQAFDDVDVDDVDDIDIE